MVSNLRFNRLLPVLPVTCGVYQAGCRYEFEVPAVDYYEKVFAYAREHTDNQLVIAYPRRTGEELNSNCEVFRLGTALEMSLCEPRSLQEKLSSYALATGYTQKVYFSEFCEGEDGVRLARCRPFREHLHRLNFEQTMNLLLPIWISIRANIGVADSLTSVLPTYGSASFAAYMEDIDSCLERVCSSLPLEFEQQAAYFAAENVIVRSSLVLRFLNKAHSLGFKLQMLDADLTTLAHWNKYAKVNVN